MCFILGISNGSSRTSTPTLIPFLYKVLWLHLSSKKGGKNTSLFAKDIVAAKAHKESLEVGIVIVRELNDLFVR